MQNKILYNVVPTQILISVLYSKMEITGEDKAAYIIIHSWFLLCFHIAHSIKKTIERDFWTVVLFKVSCLESPWKCMAPHYWNTAFFFFILLVLLFFYIFCAVEKILLSQWHLPFIPLLLNGFQVCKCYPIYLYSGATSVKHTFLSAQCKLQVACIWKLRYKQIDSIKCSLSSHRQFPPVWSKPLFLQFIQQNNLLSSV